MDNLNQETISKLKQMKIDYESPWYKASEIDNYDLKNKLLRVGCRPLKRRVDKCVLENYDDFKMQCKTHLDNLKKCQEALYLIYYLSKKDDI